jgi:hypothetical protein
LDIISLSTPKFSSKIAKKMFKKNITPMTMRETKKNMAIGPLTRAIENISSSQLSERRTWKITKKEW